jgi:SAM-dependent methyltransferase
VSSLREAWEEHAAEWVAWAGKPHLDSYWRFHRDAFLELVPEPGRRTLDLGCGEGRLSRDLKARGHDVVGLDASPTLLAAAREADPSIQTHLADAAALPFANGAFDCVVAFMSLQDVDDFRSAIRESARVLEPGGRLCLAIVHPINSAGRFESFEPDGRFVIERSYLASFRYEDTVEREGLEMTFVSDHRPLEDYVEALADAGLMIDRIREPAIPEAAIVDERSRCWQRVPLFLHARAIKPG